VSVPSEERFERLVRDVSGLRVAVAQVRGDLRSRADTDRTLARDVERLSAVVDRLATQVEALQRWRWQVIGAASAVAFLAEPVWQGILRALGVH
jgi:hypothetical protein